MPPIVIIREKRVAFALWFMRFVKGSPDAKLEDAIWVLRELEEGRVDEDIFVSFLAAPEEMQSSKLYSCVGQSGGFKFVPFVLPSPRRRF